MQKVQVATFHLFENETKRGAAAATLYMRLHDDEFVFSFELTNVHKNVWSVDCLGLLKAQALLFKKKIIKRSNFAL